MQGFQIKYLNYWDNTGAVSRSEFKSVAYYLFIIDTSLSHLFCDNRELQYLSFSIFMYKENFKLLNVYIIKVIFNYFEVLLD